MSDFATGICVGLAIAMFLNIACNVLLVWWVARNMPTWGAD